MLLLIFKKSVLKSVLIVFAVFIMTGIVIAAETLKNDDENDEDLLEMEKLMSIIDKYSDLATKTRLNADYVPGILTVVNRNEMETAGLKTVVDVLKTISGINVYIDTVGVRNISVRGIGGSIASGNVKLMVNNISVTESMCALFDLILDYPVELLDRIEIIRGPGAAIYGEYAYTGVINVITRKNDSLVSLGLGSLNTLSGSALLNYDSQNKAFRFHALFHQYHTDGSDAIAGPDAYHSQGPEMKALSNAPGPTNESQKGKHGIVSFDFKKFSCTAQVSQTKRGDFMGYNHYLYNLREDTPHQLSQNFVQISQKIDIASNLSAVLNGGLAEHHVKVVHHYVLPPGYPFLPNGFEVNYITKTRKQYGSLDVKYNFFTDHQLLLGLEYFTEKHLFEVINKNMYRHVFCLISQYEFQPIDDLSFTFGFRYDKYNDTGTSNSPRFAAVYRLTSNHIFKFQYASAFRPPTTGELVTNNTIEPSTINTYELSYTYKDTYTLGRVTLYHSIMKKVIDAAFNSELYYDYFNIDKIRSRGVEIDVEQNLWQSLKFKTSAAYMYTKNLESTNRMPLQADFIANAGIIYTPLRAVNLSTQYQYVGNRSRETGDDRKELSGYHKLNASMFIHAQKIRTKIRLGIDNVLNEDIRVPTPTAHLSPLSSKATYPGDFPRPGRIMWFDLVYEF
ncbi:MAG: TonB-dependent receptor [Candidatus Magnetomorum sp.]|nr:TonB-dependent receptor [Candidatus Magnetomorum sp.]